MWTGTEFKGILFPILLSITDLQRTISVSFIYISWIIFALKILRMKCKTFHITSSFAAISGQLLSSPSLMSFCLLRNQSGILYWRGFCMIVTILSTSSSDSSPARRFRSMSACPKNSFEIGQGMLKGEVITVPLTFLFAGYWFGLVCFTNKNKKFP